MYLQLLNIYTAFKEKGWKFEFLILYGPDLTRLEDYTRITADSPKIKPKRCYYVIRLNPETIYRLADECQLQCYNLKKKVPKLTPKLVHLHLQVRRAHLL